MASGGRDIGTGRPARQGQMPTSYIGNQNAMRGIQQGMKQLQVSGQGGLSSESQSMQVDRQQQVATPWTITNLTPDKRLVKHARALQEIRDSLQNYEVGGDFDRADLDRCVELGFDEVGRSLSGNDIKTINCCFLCISGHKQFPLPNVLPLILTPYRTWIKHMHATA